MKDFDAGNTPNLFALALAPGGVELERVAHSSLRLFGDHVVGEVFGRQSFASGEFCWQAFDAAEGIVGGLRRRKWP